ncbi:histidine--tRNA ligase [Candidatus Bathyarchaeota archaeon]|nr:histidine--tRNA ligase [Candidatus Bathyarchaeota archaeon]
MFQPPRGTRDFLPEEMLRRNWVIDKIRKVYENYGFEPLGTPAFESWELFKIKSGEDVINQIYYFKDKSDRELGLRFEWTASLARVVSSHRELIMPFKRYAIGPVWRYENPSEKRFREFWQCDADTIGVADPIADAEILAAAVNCLKSLSFTDFIIKLNDRRILEILIEQAGFSKENVLDIIRSIDKIDKIGLTEVKKELLKWLDNEDAINRLLSVISLKGKPEEVLLKLKENLIETDTSLKGYNSLKKITEYSKSFGFKNYLIIDLSLARGLDYYTGPVFEIYAKDYQDFGSIAGGGRYDEIIELFGGEPTPATGIALGFERIVPILEVKKAFNNIELGTEILVSSINENTKTESIEIAQQIRNIDIPTIVDLMGRNLRKQLEYASKKNIKKVIIIGENDLKEGYLTIRNMATGEQQKVKREELISILQRRAN